MRVMAVILLTCVVVAGQTSDALRQKYGAPVAETFRVRPDILVTVTHAQTGGACEMLIAPQLPSTPIKSNGAVLKSKVLDEIIDELVPVRLRGKLLMGSSLNITCLPDNDCIGTVEDFERVYIYRNGSIDAHRYATIQWKGIACQ
jgi:hypothetical protein